MRWLFVVETGLHMGSQGPGSHRVAALWSEPFVNDALLHSESSLALASCFTFNFDLVDATFCRAACEDDPTPHRPR